MIELIFYGIITACLTHFLNYTIGKPGSKEFSPHEIFSSYTVWLSKMRLKKVGLYAEYWMQCKETYERTKTKSERVTLKNDMRKIYYNAAEPYFTWERAIGMCPVCTGFWISLVTGIIFFSLSYDNVTFVKNVVDLLIIIVISHILTRLLSKIL